MTNVHETRGSVVYCRLSHAMLALTVSLSLGACDLGKVTVNTTSKVLQRAQPSLKQESDWDLAAIAIPGALKTVEGFAVVDPGNERLRAILMEGYCQYGSGFVEDYYEQAYFAKNYEEAEYIAQRATKMFIRCQNYALRALGKKWRENIFGETTQINALISGASWSQRDALMWFAIGLASTINYNKDSAAMIAQLPTAKSALMRVVELDDKHKQSDAMKRALPHVALGMMYTAQAPSMGGEPERAEKHFQRAIELTEGKMLLAKTYMARRLGVMRQDREFFLNNLVEVLQTSPAVWPEQRLANEIAHRRARRYLKMEKEWF